MDALVQDLAMALSDTTDTRSAGPSQVSFRQPRPRRPKTRLPTKSLSTENLAIHEPCSSDDEKTLQHGPKCPTRRHSDSDEPGPSFKAPCGSLLAPNRVKPLLSLCVKSPINGPALFTLPQSVASDPGSHSVNALQKRFLQAKLLAESDSVNENVSTLRPHTRKKRRFKRMAVDPTPSSPTKELEEQSKTDARSSSPYVRNLHRKKRGSKSGKDKYGVVQCGKRKRSTRERSLECEALLGDVAQRKQEMEEGMECDAEANSDAGLASSTSSLSGSESDAGFYTNDEGREADDEQSDWFQEPGPTWGLPGMNFWWEDGASKGEEREEAFSTDVVKQRMQHLRERMPGREIRAGHRTLGEQRGPGFSIRTSANEKLSRFLRDPGQSELRLHPMQKSERDQLGHLATLYSLTMKSEGSQGLQCPVLTKTSNTMQAVPLEPRVAGIIRNGSLSDFKRRKRIPLLPPDTDTSNQFQPCCSSTEHKTVDSHVVHTGRGTSVDQAESSVVVEKDRYRALITSVKSD